MSKTKTIRTPGLWPSITGLFQRLVAEDPIIAAVFATTYIPVALQLLESLAKREANQAFLAVLMLSGITVIVIMPLLVVRVLRIRMNQKNEADKKSSETKQEQVNAIMAARIKTIEAERDFILSQSERHEHLLLREAAKDIKAGIKEQFDSIQVGSVVSNLNKIESKYLEMEKGFSELQKSLDLLLDYKPEKELKGGIRDSYDEPTDVYTKSLEVSLKEITVSYETSKSLIRAQLSTITKLQKELEFQLGERLKEAKIIDGGKVDVEEIIPDSNLPPSEQPISGEAVPEGNEWPTVSFDPLADNDIFATEITSNEDEKLPTDNFHVKEPDKVRNRRTKPKESMRSPLVDDKVKEPENWQCSNCHRINDYKKPRCPQCGTSKKG